MANGELKNCAAFRLIHGDCGEKLLTLDAASVDLALTSPPYGKVRDYGGHVWSLDAVIQGLRHVLKPGGAICWNVQDTIVKGGKTGAPFRQALAFMEAGFRLHDVVIWRKDTGGAPDVNRYILAWEYIFIFSLGKPKTFNALMDRPNRWAGTRIHGTARQRDGALVRRTRLPVIPPFGRRFAVWTIPSVKRPQERTGHPAQMPLQLAIDLVRSYSNEGEHVLDPFTGSGTSGEAAVLLGQMFTGIEAHAPYLVMARRRISQAMKQTQMELAV